MKTETTEWIKARYCEGYNVEEIAELIGYSKTVVQKIIEGQSKKIRQEKLEPPEWYDGTLTNDTLIWALSLIRMHYKVSQVAEALGVNYQKLYKNLKGANIKQMPELEIDKSVKRIQITDIDNHTIRALKNQSEYDWAVEQRKKGYSYKQIANALGTTREWTYDHLRNVVVTRRPMNIVTDKGENELFKSVERAYKNNYSLREICNATGLSYSLMYNRLNGLEREPLVYDNRV